MTLNHTLFSWTWISSDWFSWQGCPFAPFVWNCLRSSSFDIKKRKEELLVLKTSASSSTASILETMISGQTSLFFEEKNLRYDAWSLYRLLSYTLLALLLNPTLMVCVLFFPVLCPQNVLSRGTNFSLEGIPSPRAFSWDLLFMFDETWSSVEKKRWGGLSLFLEGKVEEVVASWRCRLELFSLLLQVEVLYVVKVVQERNEMAWKIFESS